MCTASNLMARRHSSHHKTIDMRQQLVTMLRALILITATGSSFAALPPAPPKCSSAIIKSIDWGAGSNSFGVRCSAEGFCCMLCTGYACNPCITLICCNDSYVVTGLHALRAQHTANLQGYGSTSRDDVHSGCSDTQRQASSCEIGRRQEAGVTQCWSRSTIPTYQT